MLMKKIKKNCISRCLTITWCLRRLQLPSVHFSARPQRDAGDDDDDADDAGYHDQRNAVNFRHIARFLTWNDNVDGNDVVFVVERF